MKLALTGPTGFIGSHVLTDLQEHGHEVTAFVRAEPQAEAVQARGATAAIVDLYDSSVVAAVLRGVDGAIHTASPGDATSADLDAAVVDAAIDAFAGTSKPYAHVSGLWIYGSNLSVTEDSPTEAAAVAGGAPGAVPGSDDEARARLGDAFADVLLLDQVASANKARTELGWRPSHAGLVDDFRNGSYRTQQAQEQR